MDEYIKEIMALSIVVSYFLIQNHFCIYIMSDC